MAYLVFIPTASSLLRADTGSCSVIRAFPVLCEYLPIFICLKHTFQNIRKYINGLLYSAQHIEIGLLYTSLWRWTNESLYFANIFAYTAPRFGVVNLCSVSEGSES